MRILREARHAAGLTQAEVARRARVTQPTVARLEAHGANPRIETLDRLLRACGRQLDAVPLRPSSVDEGLVAERLKLAPGARILDFEASHAEADELRGTARR